MLGKAPASAKAKLGKAKPSKDAGKLGKVGKEALGKGKRKLAPRISDVSLDSEGFPGMFSSPSKKARTASSSQVMCLRRAGSRLHAAMGYSLEKPKPKTNLGKGKSKPGKALADEPKEREPWVDLKQTDANKPQPRSYLQGRVEGGKLHLIVEVAQNMPTHYLAIIGKIRCALEKDNLTKAEALAMRKDLLEKYSP